MAQKGDTVRFLNRNGGGKITRVEGKIAYVDDDGFEIPVLLKEIVVVMPAGHEQTAASKARMFDQQAFDAVKSRDNHVEDSPVAEEPNPIPELPLVETEHGDKINLVLAFEPSDVKHLDKSKFSAVIVNDSNYYLNFIFLRRAEGAKGWTMEYQGEVAPNELIDVSVLTHENLVDFEKIALQCTAFKKDKEFTLQLPVSATRKLDLTKFHKFHCFREGRYFDTPVLEIPLIRDGVSVNREAEILKREENPKINLDELSAKYKVDSGRKKKNQPNPADNPHKLLPLIEIDLHIGELLDSTAGMEPKDMLDLQLATVRKTMEANRKRIGQKIVFIHGKGEGVLRNEVLKLLRKEYPKAEIQDASFREYGFGATLVTLH